MFLTEFVNRGGRRGNAMQVLAQWRHPVASSEAQDVLHQAMCPTLHRHIRMAIEIISNLPALFIVVNLLFAHNVR